MEAGGRSSHEVGLGRLDEAGGGSQSWGSSHVDAPVVGSCQ